MVGYIEDTTKVPNISGSSPPFLIQVPRSFRNYYHINTETELLHANAYIQLPSCNSRICSTVIKHKFI